MFALNLRFCKCCLLLVALLVPSVMVAQADDPSAAYSVTTGFSFTPAGKIVSGQWNYGVFTGAAAPIVTCGAEGAVAMPATQSEACTATAASGANAVANSSVKTTNFKPGNVTAAIHVDGSASVPPPPAPGAAISVAGSDVFVQGGPGLRNGEIQWGPNMAAQVVGYGVAAVDDHILFDVYNPNTGKHTSGGLVDISAGLVGPGAFAWTGNKFSVDATSFAFIVNMSSLFIPTGEQGTVDFIIKNGFVTTSLETGIFAGLFPADGTKGDFSIALSNALLLDYGLGNLGGDNAIVTFDFGNSGEGVVSEPSAPLLLSSGIGLLGLLLNWKRTGSARKHLSKLL